MKLSTFLLQCDADNFYSSDIAAVHEHICEQNWLHPSNTIKHTSSTIQDLSLSNVLDSIPIGSINFVNRALSIGHNLSEMRPINIPPELNKYKYLKRNIAIAKSQSDILESFSLWNTDELFVKSNTRLKAGYTDVYRLSQSIPDDTEYFISEPQQYLSEWRCFVYRGNLEDIKCYQGNPWVMPSKHIVEDAIRDMGNKFMAYTLDVGVVKTTYATSVIEVHNFVSCGLYGFRSQHLLPMYVAGIRSLLKVIDRNYI